MNNGGSSVWERQAEMLAERAGGRMDEGPGGVPRVLLSQASVGAPEPPPQGGAAVPPGQ